MAQVVEQLVALVCEACRTVNTKTGDLQRPSEQAVKFAILSYAQRLMAEDWKFLEDEKTDRTVATIATYTLSGNNNNCGKIIYLSYDGEDFTKGHYCDSEEFARFYDADNAQNVAVLKWTIKGYLNKHPIATFYGTPMETGKEIFYRFKRIIDSSDPLAVLPGDMIDVIAAKMIWRFHPSAQEKQAALQDWIEALVAAKERWIPEIGLPREPQINEEQMDRNYEINMAMAGHGCSSSARRVVDVGTMRYLR